MTPIGILIALIPALGWGIQPLFLKKIGGTPVNQMLGFGIGAVVVGLIVQFALHPAGVDVTTFAISLASGAMWTLGQGGQVSSYNIMGVSKTMPLSTGLQLVGTSLIGVLAFGEWPSMTSKIFGFLAIALLIFGAYLTSIDTTQQDNSGLMKGLRVLALTSVGYWIYSAAPKLVSADGLSIFLPQMLGILLGASLFALFTQRSAFVQKESWQAAGVGLIFGIASLAYIISAQMNGVTIAYILTQLNVILATLGAIYILKEKKGQRELMLTYAGLALIVVASIITVFL